MNVKATNKVETNRYELELEVSPEEFNEAINTVYKRESKKMNIPGFRKGHAPRAFIEKYYGEDEKSDPEQAENNKKGHRQNLVRPFILARESTGAERQKNSSQLDLGLYL